jgi:hypothetical protein
VAEECSVHPNYKKKILTASDIATMTTGKRLGHPVRSLKTPFSRDYLKAEYGGVPDDELEAMGAGALRLAAVEGDLQKGCFLAGQAAGMVKKEQPAAQIIREIFEETEKVLGRSGKMGKIAVLFSGQGAQYAGMGQKLYEGSPAAKAAFDLTDALRPGTSSSASAARPSS